MMNQNAYLAACEDVLAALPVLTARVSMSAHSNALSNPVPDDTVRPVSQNV
jgi:hypothetical protein